MSEGKLPDRRDFLFLAAGAFAIAAVPVAARSRRKLISRSAPAMATTAEVAILHRDERYAFAAADAALAEIQRIDKLMTRYGATSDIGRANLMAAAQPARVSIETARVVQRAIEWSQTTDGAFDPTLAHVIDLWDIKHRSTPPPAQQVERLADRRLYRSVDVDAQAGVIRFEERDVALDLGGIACGYAVDCAVNVLREWGVRDGFINVSGDIYALGASEDGDAWQVGVRSPSDPRTITATVELSDAAIATSGDYEQFFTHEGRRYHHILDPHTAAPRQTQRHTITVRADDCMTADAASTALFGMEAVEAVKLLQTKSRTAAVITG